MIVRNSQFILAKNRCRPTNHRKFRQAIQKHLACLSLLAHRRRTKPRLSGKQSLCEGAALARHNSNMLLWNTGLCKKTATGKYDQSDVDKLFELAKTQRYPGIFAELAESFGMMMVKLEAREYRLKRTLGIQKKTVPNSGASTDAAKENR